MVSTGLGNGTGLPGSCREGHPSQSRGSKKVTQRVLETQEKAEGACIHLLCVCMWQVYVSGWACALLVHVHESGDRKWMLGIFLNYSPLYLLRQGLSLNLELTGS